MKKLLLGAALVLLSSFATSQSITKVGGNCQSGSIAGTTCHKYRVSITGLPNVDLQLRITSSRGSTHEGTVLLGTGGLGSSFYADELGGTELVNILANNGYRVVDRKWIGGWVQGVASIKAQSQRYAVLAQFVRSNIWTSGSFIATGNSGGSLEIGYGLTTWNLDVVLDAVVMTGGPPVSRLDVICTNNPPSWWTSFCATALPYEVFACTPVCATPVSVLCSHLDNSINLAEDSIIHTGATTAFPNTIVMMVLGDMDCTGGPIHAAYFSSQISTPHVTIYAEDTPHLVSASVDGRKSIMRGIIQSTYQLKNGVTPSILAFRNYPTSGSNLVFDVYGAPNSNYFLYYSEFGTALNLHPSFGWIFLNSPKFYRGGTLDVSGKSQMSIPIGLPKGHKLYFQSLTNNLSNQSRIVVQ